MQNDDEAFGEHQTDWSWSVRKIFIHLEPHGIFSLNFAYIFILRLSSVYQIKLNNNRQQEK